MSKNVLFISYDGMTDALGQSQVIPYLSGLSALGYNITIISAEKSGAYAKLSSEIKTKLDAAKISWRPVFFSNKIPGWSAWKNYKRLLNEAEKICDEVKIEIVHCRSYIPSLIGLRLKKKFGCRMLFDMRGFFADERVEGGLWNLKNPAYKLAYNFFKKKEKELFVQSDAVVSLTQTGKNIILSWKELNLSAKKITVIPCCTDLDFFSAKNVEQTKLATLREQLGIQQNDFIISYSGSIGTWYLLDEMIDFFVCLLKKKPESKFLFITNEPKEKLLEKALLKKIQSEKIIVIAATRKDMPTILSLSQVSIFFIINTFSKKASSPTKMGELMSLGVPIICNDGVGDVGEIIETTGAGIAVKNFSLEELERAVEMIDQLLLISKEKIREGAKEFYSLTNGVDKYAKIYSTLS